jgi:hypothetical protein
VTDLLEIYGISKENILENEKYLALLADKALELQNFLVGFEQTFEKNERKMCLSFIIT